MVLVPHAYGLTVETVFFVKTSQSLEGLVHESSAVRRKGVNYYQQKVVTCLLQRNLVDHRVLSQSSFMSVEESFTM